MLLKFYKSNVSAGLLLIPVLAVIICASIFFRDFGQPKLIFDWQNDVVTWVWSNKLINFTITLVVLLVNVLLLNQSFNKTMFYSKVTYVPALVYLILYSFTQNIGFSTNLILHGLSILIFNELFLLEQNKSGTHQVFKSSFLMGTIVGLAPYYFPVIFVVFIALILIRPYVWREWAAGLLGAAIPLIWYLSLKFIYNKSLGLDLLTGRYAMNEQYQLVHYLQLSFLIIIILVSFFKLRMYYANNVAFVKKQVLILSNYAFFVSIAFLLSYFTFAQFDFTGIIALTYVVVIGSLNDKSDTFISLILTVALVINIINLFI
jgi:hypothetical protein